MTVVAKNLILDLLSTLRGRPMPVRALVAAAAVFQIGQESLRVALARLLAQGLIQRDERGLYRMAEKARPVQSHVESWTEIEQRMVPWQGAWVGVHTAGHPRSDRRAGRRHDRAFRFLGLKEFEPGLWLRPDNLCGGVAAARQRLRELGLSTTAAVFTLRDLENAEERAALLWRVAELRANYRQMTVRLKRSACRLAKMPTHGAMVESFVTGGEAIHMLVFDPLLPEPLVPVAERRALVEELKRYDKLGRGCWRDFMRGYGAAHADARLERRWIGTPTDIASATEVRL